MAMNKPGSTQLTGFWKILALAPLACAAQAEAQETDVEGSAIVVTGIRSSLDSALRTKREADTVVDAISAEDVGSYPDINIAESAQRISGVQINRARGEGQSVTIRGLPPMFTLATLNGSTVANALVNSEMSASRTFDFSILPSEFVRSLEVYKAPTADLEEGGLAGTVNVRTPRALEIGRRVLTGSVQGEYSDTSGKVGPRAAAFFADTFADGRVGLTLGLSYQERRPETSNTGVFYTYRTEANALGSGAQAGDLDGDGRIDAAKGVRIPNTLTYGLTKEKRERISTIGSLEFRATDTLTLYAEGFYSSLNVKANRSENNWFVGNSRGLVSSSMVSNPYDGIPTVRAIELNQLDVRANGRYEDRSGHISQIHGGANWESDKLHVELSASRSESGQVLDNIALATTYVARGSVTIPPGDDLASVGYLGTSLAQFQDPASYRVASINGELGRRSHDRLWDAKFDVSRDFGNEGLTSIAVGLRYADRAQYQDNRRLTVLPAGVSALYGGLAAGSVAGSFSAAPFMYTVGAGKGTFLGSYDGSAIFPTSFLVSNPDALILQKSAAQLIAAGIYTNDATAITDVGEESLAGYGRADFRFGKLSGNLGLRAVRTRQTSIGVSPDLTGITLDLRAGAVTQVPAAAPVAVRRSYTEFLPSLNLRFEASDTLQFRFAASRTIARPNLADIAPTTSVNGLAFTVTQKSPMLEPFRSNNLDFTAEWYFGKGGVLAVSGFYKNLRSLIQNSTSVESLPVRVIASDGSVSSRDINFTFNRLINGRGVKVKGFEISYQQAFTFLPAPFDGLGAGANYTFIGNSDPQRLTAASRNNFNVTGYYEKGPVSIRLSYAWRGKYLSSPTEFPSMGIETKAFGSLDGSASLKLTDSISLTAEAVNLFGAAEVSRFLTNQPSTYSYSGRRLLFGARASF